MSDLISRQAALDAFGLSEKTRKYGGDHSGYATRMLYEIQDVIEDLPDVPDTNFGKWIPVSERLPEVGRKVILSLTDGAVFVGSQGKPDRIWQVTQKDGSKLWVYDPNMYTDDINSLPTSKDCWFDTIYPDGMAYTSVTSLTHRANFPGVNAWMPLPEPYHEDNDELD